ncbi:condensation domain-containing protein [Dactylosporangium sp. NBC_01737]|uniref:condensation domain-containing protein n=1 Tax=Dactylosporangium sp. NBC_01737 TaxID=2975959 RepID=UPI002E0E9C6D|nr:condensation domain-containing protein [Dactylosporangium sp. NBC_01737]
MRIAVPFEGEGSGVGELTWGQFAAWRSMQVVEATEWAGGTMPLADGTTVRDVVATLGFIMSRHQSLRTRLLAAGDGPPKQVLAASGAITLEVYDDDGDPERLAATIRARYEAQPWDPYTDWPVRMAVVADPADPDRALWFVALYCHMVIDGYGFEALIADLANLEPVTGRHLAPVGGIQPLDLAAAQQEPSALRQHTASLRYWERHLRAIEPRRFPAPLTPRPQRWCEATLTSPATHLALAAVAGRTKVHTGTILLAAYAVMLGRLSGQPVGAFRIVVSNRFRPGFAESVSNLAQAGLAVIDTGGCTFDEAVARTFKSQLTAGMYAYYHPRDLWALVERVGAERGVELDTGCYFNDRRRSAAQAPALDVPAPERITAALPHTALRWGPSSDEWDATCFLHVDAAGDAVDLTWRVDTAAVSPRMLEACLRGIESLVVDAALDQAGTRPAVTAGRPGG